MRVISGSARGKNLESLEGLSTRPTLDRVKEAVFSMLLPYISDSVVLDLFAGSGALGIESLSRGASKAVFVDVSDDAISCIKDNLSRAKFLQLSNVIEDDAVSFLNSIEDSFDIIFLDPPYRGGLYEKMLNLINNRNLLSPNGIIVAEWDSETGFTDKLYGFSVMKTKKYGRVGITVLKRGD